MIGSKVRLDPSQTGQEADALRARLRKYVIGQDEAVAEIVNIYQMHLIGMTAPGRPVGNLLLIGPTGSGKTRIVEATAEALVGNASAVVKVDCAEFQHSHEIAKLIGSPPGYLGHRETHPLLSQENLDRHHTEHCTVSFVLFDEIEKASDALWNLLLGILDKASLTLGDNRRVDFSRAMIFLTGNLGAAEMSAILSPKMGFYAGGPPHRNGDADGSITGKISAAAMHAARRKFTPEFLNRLDKIVVFKPLGEAELKNILEIELAVVQQRIHQSQAYTPFTLGLTARAKDILLQEGTDPRYGARHLKRAIDRMLVHPLANIMATHQVRCGDLVRVDVEEGTGHLVFLREAGNAPTGDAPSSPIAPLAAVCAAREAGACEATNQGAGAE
ncbi:MAG TPA: AAA family ATPase [Bryobacteraceae bacterium]|nr:AAA family ATPase [Bryobacteraceae bacterium]